MKKLIVSKILTFGKKDFGGRSYGRITVPRRAALVKRSYRFLDFKRTLYPKHPIIILKKNVYDPNRSGRITLVIYPNGILGYILETTYTDTQKLVFNLKEPAKIKEKGWSNYLKNLPLGSVLFGIETIPGLGAKLMRAAGTSAVLLKKDDKKNGNALIKLKSGGHRLIPKKAVASVGVVGNRQHFLRDYGKASITRLKGRRPRVRPSVMNPVDHPMGGRTKGGCAPKSKTGKLSIGKPTSKKKAHSLIVVSVRKSKKQRIS